METREAATIAVATRRTAAASALHPLAPYFEGVWPLSERPEAALAPEELGVWRRAVPKHDPAYVLTEAHANAAQHVALRMKLRQPSIGLFGVPGTGKNALAREVAALFELPFYAQDLSASVDLQELIGGTALVQGTTIERLGKVLWFAERGAVICLNEVQAVDAEMQTLLHDLVAEGRTAVPSLEGTPRMVTVHPAAFFVLTWNPFQGRMPEPALLSRLGPIEFPLPTPGDECRMVAAILTHADPGLAVRSVDVLPDQALFRDLRRLYAAEELSVYPDLRFLVNFVAHRRALGLGAAARTLVALAPQLPDERDRALRQMARLLQNHLPGERRTYSFALGGDEGPS